MSQTQKTAASCPGVTDVRDEDAAQQCAEQQGTPGECVSAIQAVRTAGGEFIALDIAYSGIAREPTVPYSPQSTVLHY
jgi:hypothetical protein